jgi:SAM-dependent methyltransferase
VLDVGAGTGRVALALAADGHEVVALDREPDLLAALRERAGDLPVDIKVKDPTATQVLLDAAATLVPAPLVIGVLWLLLDRLVLAPLERATIERWGMVRGA